MTGDLSQLRFNRNNRYSKVIHQQGRVFSDADFIEAAYIAAYFEEIEKIDVIGSNGGPVHDAGFLVVDGAGNSAAGVKWADLCLSEGRYYVRGKVAEILLESSKLPKLQDCIEAGPAEPAKGTYAVSLEVYERYVAPVEEREEMLDDALRGVDTTGRTRIEWRIRLDKSADGIDCADVDEAGPLPPRVYPQLTADSPPVDENSDPCSAPNLGGYQGLENQLYRVEVFEDGAKPSLTWARDNASVLSEVKNVVDNNDNTGTIELFTLGRDPKIGIQQGDILEVLTRSDLQHNRRGVLVQNFTLPEGESVVVVNTKAEWDKVKAIAGIAFLRRWHGFSQVQSNKKLFLEPERQDLFVTIDKVNLLVAGDYWCIPTRALSGKVLWPADINGNKIARPPFGTYLDRATIGILESDGSKWTLTSDCRNLFYPLTEQTRLVYVGGDGQEAMPGEEVPWPLEVGVVNGVIKQPGAKVVWTIAGDGEFVGFAGGLLKTNADGLSTVRVKLKPNHPTYTQTPSDPLDANTLTARVTAVLLDEHENPIDVPVHFNLNKSIARNVAYVPICDSFKDMRTVQKAIDRLATTRRLTMEGGDSQVVRDLGTSPLPEPLVVRLWNPCGPVAGEIVIFIPHGGLLWNGKKWVSDPVEIKTRANGTAGCYWKPDAKAGIQDWLEEDKKAAPPEIFKLPRTPEVIATVKEEAEDGKTRRIRFTCQFLDAADIAFDNAKACNFMKEAQSVQDALEILCDAAKISNAFDLLEVQIADKPFQNGQEIELGFFRKGLTFIFSKDVELSKDCFSDGHVTFEAETDVHDWMDRNWAARCPLYMSGQTEMSGNKARWLPPEETVFPYTRFMSQMNSVGIRKLLVRVTMRGDYINANRTNEDGSNQNVFLCAGSSPFAGKDRVVDNFPRPGGNLEFWFWVVAKGEVRQLNISGLKATGERGPRRVNLHLSMAFDQPVPANGATVLFTLLLGGQTTQTSPIKRSYVAGETINQGQLVFDVKTGELPSTAPLQLRAELDGGNTMTADLQLEQQNSGVGISVERLSFSLGKVAKIRVTATFKEVLPIGQTRALPCNLMPDDPTGAGMQNFDLLFVGNGARSVAVERDILLSRTGGAPFSPTGWTLKTQIDGVNSIGWF